MRDTQVSTQADREVTEHAVPRKKYDAFIKNQS